MLVCTAIHSTKRGKAGACRLLAVARAARTQHSRGAASGAAPHLLTFVITGAHCSHAPSTVRQKPLAGVSRMLTQSHVGAPLKLKGAAHVMPAGAGARNGWEAARVQQQAEPCAAALRAAASKHRHYVPECWAAPAAGHVWKRE